jgi:hypothetical protein
MNKRAKILLIGIVILFVSYVMFRLYVTTQSKINKFESIIGQKQLQLIKTYQKGEKALYFIDEAAQLAFNAALYESFNEGFGGCGKLGEYSLYNTEEKDCYPNMKDNLKKNFDKYFKEYFDLFPEEIPEIEYEYYILENTNLDFVGKPKQYLRMDVNDNEDYNFKGDIIVIEQPKEIEEPLIEKPDNDPNEDPIVPDDEFPPNEPQPQGNCQFVADYAQRYLGCVYSLTEVAILTPETCNSIGLTCATFVGSAVYYTLGADQLPYGHGRAKCEGNKMTKIGTSAKSLLPGDVFQTELRKSNGAYTAWGHTGMYVGRGYVSNPDGVYCFKSYTPDSNGDYIFIHSYGWQNKGKPGVCYDSYSHLFIDDIFVLTSFCRPNKCV